MKNIIYFNGNMEPVLLVNEEAELNSIYIDIETSAATNQILQIGLGSNVYSYSIPSSTSVDFQLQDALWAIDGSTRFRLVNDEATSEWFTIDFPETISTDASLYEETSTSYAMQGQTSQQESTVETRLVVYTNERGYSIDDIQTKIIMISFLVTKSDTKALFNATISLEVTGVTDTATLTFQFMKNLIRDTIFLPAQTVKNGKYIITLSYPISDLAANVAHALSVFLSIDEGTVEIAQQQIQASILASGLASTNAFTGIIDIEDSTGDFTFAQITKDSAGVDSVTITTQRPTAIITTETAGEFELSEITFTEQPEEAILIGDTVSSLTWQELSDYMWGTLESWYTWGA